MTNSWSPAKWGDIKSSNGLPSLEWSSPFTISWEFEEAFSLWEVREVLGAAWLKSSQQVWTGLWFQKWKLQHLGFSEDGERLPRDHRSCRLGDWKGSRLICQGVLLGSIDLSFRKSCNWARKESVLIITSGFEVSVWHPRWIRVGLFWSRKPMMHPLWASAHQDVFACYSAFSQDPGGEVGQGCRPYTKWKGVQKNWWVKFIFKNPFLPCKEVEKIIGSLFSKSAESFWFWRNTLQWKQSELRTFLPNSCHKWQLCIGEPPLQ